MKPEALQNVRLLDPKGDNILYTFDADLQGRGLSYGDGKINRNYVKNWKETDQSMKWDVRLDEPAIYNVSLSYNTMTKGNSGLVTVEIDGKDYDVSYPAFEERSGQTSVNVGKVQLKKGTHKFVLKGKSFEGGQFMNPIAINLSK